MRTWFNIYPIYLLPFVVVFFPGLIPSFEAVHFPVAMGQSVRVFFLDHLVLPLLNAAAAWELASWYQHASFLKQVFLHFVVSLNMAVLLSPVLYIVGSVYLSVHNQWVLAQFSSKRKAAQ